MFVKEWNVSDRKSSGRLVRNSPVPPRGESPADANVMRLEAIRTGNLAWARKRQRDRGTAFTRQSFTLPREEAREAAKAYFLRFPKAAYGSEIESWRVLPGDIIEFTMRRYPTAD